MSQQKLMSSSLLVLMLSMVSFANDSCAMMKSGSAEENNNICLKTICFPRY